MNDVKTYAVDFDGTLCEEAYPEIGAPKWKVINKINKLKEEGNEIVLWTCRGGDDLRRALEWCAHYGLHFDAVNEPSPHQLSFWKGDRSAKIFANTYIDDRAVHVDDFVKEEPVKSETLTKKLFMDLEMTGLTMGDKMISIGIVSEDGYHFYAENVFATLDQCEPDNQNWMKMHVYDNLIYTQLVDTNVQAYSDYMRVYLGNPMTIASLLGTYFAKVSESGKYQLELVLDVGHYDFCFFAELFGGAFGLPEYMVPSYIEFNDILRNKLNLTGKEAFDISREELLKERNICVPKTEAELNNDMIFSFDKQHNALYDAIVTKLLYEAIV